MREVFIKCIGTLLFISMIVIVVLISCKVVQNLINKNNNETILKEEKLNITKSNELSEYLPKNIKKINFINYMSDEKNPTTYEITDIEKMKGFIDLFFETYWDEQEKNEKIYEGNYWSIEIIGDTSLNLNTKGLIGETEGLVEIKNSEIQKVYKVDKNIYLEIQAYTNERYYLHESNLELPKQNICYIAQKKALTGLSENEKNIIQEEIRLAHLEMEYTLVDAVNVLKDSKSVYWTAFTVRGPFNVPNTETIVDSNGRFLIILERIEKLIDIVKDEETQIDFKLIYNTLKEGMDEHDLKKCFEAHEILHDYDYFVINTPVFLDVAPTDWSGIYTYFGRVTIIE